MLHINGLEAWITDANKVPLVEYDIEVDDQTDTITCWIAGEPGQTFAIRWRELEGRDSSGFVTMDGYELGGRVLQASSHAPALFSRVSTSPTSCIPLTFTDLPRNAGIGTTWKTLGTVVIDIHEVQVGEARLQSGFFSYYRSNEHVALSSGTPFSSTEVESLQKIATFVFKYRPMDVLRQYGIAPAPEPHLGDKRRISLIEDSTTSDEEDSCGYRHESADAVEELRKLRPRIALRAPFGSPCKRIKL